MNYTIDVIVLLLLFSLFGYLHSLLASVKVKIFFKKIFGKAIAFYRFGYNIISFVLLYLIWDLGPHPSLQIYTLSPPFDYLVLIPQILAIVGIAWCFKYANFREFIGLNQIDRYLKNQYSENDLDENYTLRIEGPYKYSRHPIYFFSIVFLLCRAEMNLFYLTMFIAFTSYFFIATFYEERKMVRLFGEDYKNYQKNVPRIFPIKIFRSKI